MTPIRSAAGPPRRRAGPTPELAPPEHRVRRHEQPGTQDRGRDAGPGRRDRHRADRREVDGHRQRPCPSGARPPTRRPPDGRREHAPRDRDADEQPRRHAAELGERAARTPRVPTQERRRARAVSRPGGRSSTSPASDATSATTAATAGPGSTRPGATGHASAASSRSRSAGFATRSTSRARGPSIQTATQSTTAATRPARPAAGGGQRRPASAAQALPRDSRSTVVVSGGRLDSVTDSFACTVGSAPISWRNFAERLLAVRLLLADGHRAPRSSGPAAR